MKVHPGYDWFTTPAWLRRFGPMRAVSASLLDRAGLHYFTIYAALNGVMMGVFNLGNVVLKKTLNADELAIGVISALSVVALLFGIFGSELVVGRDKRPFIFWLGLLSRGSLVLFFFCRDVTSFIVVSGLFYFLNALLMPAVFSMWQANVSAVARSRLWGLTVTAATLISMAATYVASRVLDHDPWSYTWLLPAGGVVAVLSILILAQSPLRGKYK
ncbi:MAG TPA: MFS transporter, partial [Firmicutes bacterium]|nr:MFS transporter [Bacillota bacterium]